jgi:hypothetical protein
MPIEIKEMVIRATIVDSDCCGQSEQSEAASVTSKINKQQIVEECVEQVLNVLERMKDR